MNAEKLLFTGDNVNPHLWIHRPGAVAPEEWMDTARLIPSYMEQGYTAHTGHGSGHLTKADSLYPERGAKQRSSSTETGSQEREPGTAKHKENAMTIRSIWGVNRHGTFLPETDDAI